MVSLITNHDLLSLLGILALGLEPSLIKSVQILQITISISLAAQPACDHSESVNSWLHCTHLLAGRHRSFSHVLKARNLWDSSNLNLRFSRALSKGR